jgi:hypothetical protein
MGISVPLNDEIDGVRDLSGADAIARALTLRADR